MSNVLQACPTKTSNQYSIPVQFMKTSVVNYNINKSNNFVVTVADNPLAYLDFSDSNASRGCI